MIPVHASRLEGWGPTVLRAVVGVVFLLDGWDKFFGLGHDVWRDLFAAQGIPLAGFAVVVVALTEIVAGAALALGLFARWAAALLAVDMTVALLVVGLDGGFWVWNNGVSFPLALLAATVALLLTGPGEASLDGALARRRTGPAPRAETEYGTTPTAA